MYYDNIKIGDYMKNKKGFTLTELLVVIAIISILAIIALPNVIKTFNDAKKQTFLTQARTIYREAQRKYADEGIDEEEISRISSTENSLALKGNKIEYDIRLDSEGNITDFKAYDGTYCISGVFSDASELVMDKVVEGECKIEEEIIETVSFAEDPWETIVKAVKSGNTPNYEVGDTKEIDLGSNGKHTVRIANMSTLSECNNSNFSQTACGFVIEFTDIITKMQMNTTATNIGGWEKTQIRTYVNNDIYNSMPQDLRKGIIDTKVISNYGKSDNNNIETLDKIYLLSITEVLSDNNNLLHESISDLTRQLDYYKNINATKAEHAKKIYENFATHWWLRTANDGESSGFMMISDAGEMQNPTANNLYGVSPAFRIG